MQVTMLKVLLNLSAKHTKVKIVADETFVAGDTDFQAALTKMKGKEFDAIVVPGYYTEAGKIVNQARGMGIDKPIVGGDGFNGEEFVQQATAERASNILLYLWILNYS